MFLKGLFIMKNNIRLTFQKTIKVMLLFSFLLSLFLYPVVSVHAEEFTVTDKSGTAVVGDSSLNVRSGPGKDYDKLGSVSSGEALTVTGETDNNWYRINYSGKDGYVSSKYVTLSDNPGTADTSGASNTLDYEDNGNYEEGSSQNDNIFTTSPKLMVLLAIIIILVIIMVVTIIMIKKNDAEDEYDDEYDDDDDDGYDDDDDEEQYNEEDEYEEAEPVSPKAAPRPAITEEDYRLDIDPRIFDEEKPFVPVNNVSEKEEKLDAAMSKLEELQLEIERLKNSEE